MAAWIPAALSVASMLFKSKGVATSQQGYDAAAAGAREDAQRIATEKKFEADQLQQNAVTTVGISQVAAQEQQRQSRLVQSRTLAVAAASGGGVSDPTIVNMLARTAGEGTYRANTALYGGEERARLMRMQAAADNYEGASAIRAGELKAQAYGIQADAALATSSADLATSGASLFKKYNDGSLFSSSSGTGTPGAGSPTGAGDIGTFT